MQKEARYQDAAQHFIEQQTESHLGRRAPIYKEEFSRVHDAALQDGASPFVRDASVCPELASYGIVGLLQKVEEFNRGRIEQFLQTHGLSLTVGQVAALMCDDFMRKYRAAHREYELFTLIFSAAHEVQDAALRRRVTVPGTKEALDYNVVHYEAAGQWSGKNAFFVIRERRIPVQVEGKSTERPDFMVYLNGIPLVLIEYKTEDSGVAQGLHDFEVKTSYRCAPFKVAVSDGRHAIFFSNLESLQLKEGGKNAFDWVHYDKTQTLHHAGGREYSNAEYFFNEMLCQPQNLYRYCVDGCAVVRDGGKGYLLNARIQQYYALKDTSQTLQRAVAGSLALPFNYEFAHAQRSGKTITMKLLSYLVVRHYSKLFHTLFIYTPDLQIKKVLGAEFSRAGQTRAVVEVIEDRPSYRRAVKTCVAAGQSSEDAAASFRVYIVNMQKLADDDVLVNMHSDSTGVLTFIDEAHLGQTSKLAQVRDSVFPNSTMFLFTATGKNAMYTRYFPDNDARGFRSRFTSSDARRCNITVPVHFLRASTQASLGEKARQFSDELERRLGEGLSGLATLYDVPEEDDQGLGGLRNRQTRDEVEERLRADTGARRLAYVCAFLSEVASTVAFRPKAIIYVDSVAMARKYIQLVQSVSADNMLQGFRFGADFSELTPATCSLVNPGIVEPADVEQAFVRSTSSAQAPMIDVLIAVDKYQKGFDLAELMVTFLDTSIREESRMNQIFTRTATKRQGKTVGYCMDLTFNRVNVETFAASMARYDSEEVADCFVDEELIAQTQQSLRAAFERVQDVLGLAPADFTANAILQEVLNDPDLAQRERKQNVFFRVSRSVVSDLRKLGSPLYFRPFVSELRALLGAFEEFKQIYGDDNHPERSKIKLEMDDSLGDGSYLTSSEIRRVIADVLRFVGEADMASLLNFDYVAGAHREVDLAAERALLSQKAREEKKVADLTKAARLLTDYLERSYKSLFEHIRNLLFRISEDRTLVYDAAVQQELANVEQRLAEVKSQIQTTISEQFAGNALSYWLVAECRGQFQREGIYCDDLCLHTGKVLEGLLKIHVPQLDIDLPVFDKVKSLSEVVVATWPRFASFLPSFGPAEAKVAAVSALKAYNEKMRAQGLTSFFNDDAAFLDYLKRALTSHFQFQQG